MINDATARPSRSAYAFHLSLVLLALCSLSYGRRLHPVANETSPVPCAFAPPSSYTPVPCSTFTTLNDDSIATPALQESLSLPRTALLSVSACTHLLTLHGINACIDVGGATYIRVLDILVDADMGRKYLGRPAFVETAFGHRFPTTALDVALSGRFDESHRDQCLATLGHARATIDCALRSAGCPGPARTLRGISKIGS